MPAYIIRSGEDGPVKIGHTDDLIGRLRTLQTGQPERLTVLRVVDGEGDIEGALHERFKEQRLRGEWFTFVPEMLHFDPAQVWAAGRKTRGAGVAAANSAMAAALRDVSIAELARVTDASPRTVENWKTGRGAPDWRSVSAMLRNDRLRPLVLKAALA